MVWVGVFSVAVTFVFISVVTGIVVSLNFIIILLTGKNKKLPTGVIPVDNHLGRLVETRNHIMRLYHSLYVELALIY